MLLLVAALLALGNARFAGAAGMRRYESLSDERARAQHDVHRAGMQWYVVALVACACVDAGVAVWVGSRRGLVIAVSTAVLAGVAGWLNRSARANVLAGFARRDLTPLHQRELSARRDRRVRQILGAALVAYLLLRLAPALDDEASPWLFGLVMAGLIALVVASIAAAWAGAWRYGDETPDES